MANYLTVEKRKQIFHLLCEGNGVRSITRLVGCSTNTVSALQIKYCSIIEFINKKYIRELEMEEVEADEIFTFIGRKSNIRYIYVALDRVSKLVIHFRIGKRDTDDAKEFLSGLSIKLKNKTNISTDWLPAYVSATNRNQYGRKDALLSAINIIRAKEENKSLPKSITNNIESHNGNIRQHVSRLTRKTRCFSKKEEGLRMHLTLFFFYYNFIKTHTKLRATPAAVAGVTDEANWIDKILEYDMLFSENMANKSKNTFGVLDPGSKKIISIGTKDQNEFIEGMSVVQGVNRSDRKRGAYSKATKIIKLVS